MRRQAAVRALAGVTYADPLRFAIDAVRRIYLEGATLREIAPDFLPMLGVAAVAMPLAGWCSASVAEENLRLRKRWINQ